MWPYLVCFAVSTGCLGASHVTQRHGTSRLLTKALIGCTVLFPCLLAAVRDSSVGTDVTKYGEAVFLSAGNMPIDAFFARYAGDIDILYLLVTYGFAQLTSDIVLYFFFLQLLAMVPVVVAVIVLCRSYAHIGLAVYYLLFFAYSLNLMRQSIALSLVLVSVILVERQRFWWFSTVVLIAAGFHSTALLALALYPLCHLLNRRDRPQLSPGMDRFRYVVVFGLFLLTATMVVATPALIRTFHTLRPTFTYQLNHLGQGTLSAGLALAGCMALFFYWRFLTSWFRRDDDPTVFGLSVILLFSVVIFQMTVLSPEMYRLSLYFMIVVVVLLPRMMAGIISRRERWFFAIPSLCLFAAYSYIRFVVLRACEVVPYSSEILGI